MVDLGRWVDSLTPEHGIAWGLCMGKNAVPREQARACRGLRLHYEVWKYYQSPSKAHAKILQILMVGCSLRALRGLLIDAEISKMLLVGVLINASTAWGSCDITSPK